jgi:hypothetical protein
MEGNIMASNKTQTTFNGIPIEMGGYALVEFGPDLLMWMIVNNVMPRSVKATILEAGRTPYLQGRAMDIYLEHVREYRRKDNPPPLWGLSQNPR